MTTPSKAFVLALTFGLATPHFSTHGGNLWSHNTVLPFLLLGLIALRSHRPYLAAMPLTSAVLVRPDTILTLAFASIYVWIFLPSARTRFLVLAALSGGALGVLCLGLYRFVVPPYYLAGGYLSLQHFREALIGHLFSPNRGLFVFAPIFLLSLHGLFRALRSGGRERPFYGFLGAIIAAHWLTISLFAHWWGGHSYGPRLFSPGLPALVILLLPSLEELHQSTGVRRVGLWSLAVLVLAWSLFVQSQGAWEKKVLDWNLAPDVDSNPQRVWDWGDMQVFRGFLRGTNAD